MCSNCVHDMTCIEYRHAHSVVSRYPANLASRHKYTSDKVWRDNEVRLYLHIMLRHLVIKLNKTLWRSVQ